MDDANNHLSAPTPPAEQAQITLARFHETVLPHLDAAYNFARFLSRDPDASQDIVQESFLRAYRSFWQYRGGDARFWIFAIVRNSYRSWAQGERRKARVEFPLPGNPDSGNEAEGPAAHAFACDQDTPEMALIRKSESLRVREVIGMLPEAMREILVLREFEDFSYRQISEIIEVPIGTVMSRLARARHEFGLAWKALGNDQGSLS
ncbi:sigma-70 family RNA polymerase sigma factor [Tabrizicola sp.]|uniref:sigma-70 family RNA polymerase sigma factor n=1 Tax=Tabrizicola sp. TaxID=2005166 RepID=UPI00286D2E56|nr:sigma-70 family RNA polymerase sigma factor [Tabrizicola sp.]